ncbi:MAG: nitrous oxide reductase accessory protein NosL [Gammaproteobacteria bacterium]|nr:nitrous oxide reductase accessory protein NosL [Gammaproteobacteria bacterium]
MIKSVLTVLLCWLLFSCSDKEPVNKLSLPIAFEDSDSCHFCAMMITAYPGPKGQAYEKDINQVRKFCATSDMFLWYQQLADRNNITEMYVHDMSLSPWNNPDDKHLIQAEQAFYVIGSKKSGSMGPTLATFSQEKSARDFAAGYGGRVLLFYDLMKELDTTD